MLIFCRIWIHKLPIDEKNRYVVIVAAIDVFRWTALGLVALCLAILISLALRNDCINLCCRDDGR